MKTLRFKTIRLLNEQKQQNIYKSMHKNAKEKHESVGWISKERQELRFEKLIYSVNLENTKILDFGCGLGDLYGFLTKRGVVAHYTGIDLVDSFIKKAKQTYPNGNFFKSSLFEIEDEFDYVFSSGTYAFCQKELFFELVKKSFAMAKNEYRFNLLLDAGGKGYLRLTRKELEEFLRRLTPNLHFEYGYLENDITVYMGKL